MSLARSSPAHGFSSTENEAHRHPPPWDRPDRIGLALSMALPLVAVLIGNGLVALFGAEEEAAYQAVPWNPPGWLIAAIWTAIYPMWGAARWKTATADDVRSNRSWWLVALIVWGFCYPVVIEFVGTMGSVIANGLSLALAIVALLQVRPVSRAAAWLIAPSLVWLVIANALGLSALEYAS